MKAKLWSFAEKNALLKLWKRRVECALDETQQYLRRDCLEINGVPILSYENLSQLVKEVSSLAGVEIDDRHIAAAHKLPDSKNVKNRLIVKFIQRDKREELYKNLKNLVGKNISHLCSGCLIKSWIINEFEKVLNNPQSEYYSVLKLNNIFNTTQGKGISLFHCNIRSLTKNLTLSNDVLCSLDSRPDIVAKTETRLSSNSIC